MILGIILLAAFVKLSVHYHKPIVLAGAYTAVAFLLNLAISEDFLAEVLAAPVTMALMWLYFWLLDRYFESGLWWLIMIIFPVGMFILTGLMK
ncbi:hypothetical protein [Leptolyngbya sp. 7M]|uniref:hypothetical protein n=1 Tax=Leptolyngbya sp. 7M TaxID=2812896 RepID=UPI001B8D8C57|nr:hypothetical protein [Leptolyngbya sp. 7M]QYO67318.1 hypothetical protein JVX88_11235 [Leptolyngbya sp. 7M]